MKQTLVVNAFAGPGTGKSTTIAGLFSKLKVAGIDAEIVHEYAKDLTWEKREKALSYQPYIAGKQSYHVHRLLGEVDCVLTDSPILLSTIYQGPGYSDYLGAHLFSQFRQWETLNFFLVRNSHAHRYNEAGRNQTEEEAVALDDKIKSMLINNHIEHRDLKIMPNGNHLPLMADIVITRLKQLGVSL